MFCDLPDWLETKIIPEPNSGCWLWLGGIDRHGYGVIKLGRHQGKQINQPAHRLVYEFYRGPVSADLVMDHLCKTPACVNPLHQTPTTHKINILRGTGAAARNSRKQFCNSGHSLSDAYLVGGTRKCRVCQLKNMQRYYKRKTK